MKLPARHQIDSDHPYILNCGSQIIAKPHHAEGDHQKEDLCEDEKADEFEKEFHKCHKDNHLDT